MLSHVRSFKVSNDKLSLRSRGETHKNDVLLFCRKMSAECRHDVRLIDRESAELIWNFLELLIKQNGVSGDTLWW